MGLDMYAFSLDRSEAFATAVDVLNYRIPKDGKDLPMGAITTGLPSEVEAYLADPSLNGLLGLLAMPVSHLATSDIGAAFLDSKYVLPGSTLLHRWRKHPNLHGWMHRRWASPLATPSQAKRLFNQRHRVVLSTRSLIELERAVLRGKLPRTTGPGFGESDGSERTGDLEFIAKAREALAADKFVYYTSWW